MKKLCILLIFTLAPTVFAERFEYRSDVNRWIYGEDVDTIGVRDTILIDQHIQIEDINIFCGIGRWGILVPEVLIIITSPQLSSVWLHNWTPDTFFQQFVWYDTDRQEDGPGHLEDYAGSDAYGPWELFCFDPFQGLDSFYWYYWCIEVIGSPLESVTDNNSALPTQYEFSNIYPNPFNSEALFQYGLPEGADVTFSIYNIEGRLVKRIACGKLPAGYHSLLWDSANNDGQKVTSGVYMVKMTAGDHQFTRKAVLLK